MKNQAFGVEIELTGLSRRKAARVLAEYFQNEETHKSSYDRYEVKDNKGRIWTIMRDSSLRAERKTRGNIISADDEYRVEFVTPICKYEDIETIQEIIRLLRKAGAIANDSCGIHIHVDASKHDRRSLKNIVNIFYSKQDLIYKALEVNNNRENYCKKLEPILIEEINSTKVKDKDDIADVWYKRYRELRSNHYNSSRYHGLNLHATFTKGTVEFRLFNGTTHAGKIKAYIQFCLAISNQALIQKSASRKITQTTNDKYTFRTWLLRLGLIGDEFKTCRTHLLANLKGDTAFRHSRAA